MINKYLAVFLLISLCSCSKRDGEDKTSLLSYFINISDTEDKGVKEILGFYGGYCQYYIGAVASTIEGESGKYFELELSQSEALSVYANNPEMITSNMAFMFYKNLTDEEKNKYLDIKATLLYEDGSKIEHTYSNSLLEVVLNKSPLVNEVVEIIEEKDFDKFRDVLANDRGIRYDMDELIRGLKEVEPSLGKVLDYKMYGFKFISRGTQNFLIIYGAIVRDVQNHELKVHLNTHDNLDEIIMVEYKW